MELSVRDRIILLDCLPPQANLADYRVLHQLRMDLSLSPEEQEAVGLKIVPTADGQGSSYTWSSDVKKDFSFIGRPAELVREALKKLDTEGRVNDQNIHMFDLFGVE